MCVAYTSPPLGNMRSNLGGAHAPPPTPGHTNNVGPAIHVYPPRDSQSKGLRG